jgi:Secretion system C-terminal sorting domain/Bacterial Ig domain
MHPKYRSFIFPFVAFTFLLIFASPGLAGDGPIVGDSLLSLAPGEPTLQEIFDSLGYTIDVDLDEVGWETFCSAPGTSVAMILVRISESSLSANSGWYNAVDSSEKYELFTATSAEGDSAEFVVGSMDSIGFYMTPNLISYDSWYTQTGYNVDLYDHAKIYPTGVPYEYFVVFEDLKDGGDVDFNDLIIRVRFESAAPTLVLPDDMYFNVCFENYVCFMVEAYDQNCLGDTLTLEMLEGYGDFTTVTEPGAISTEVCFLPWASDSTYRFIFQVTDNSGASVIDTFVVEYDINGRPTMSLPDDFDTLLCEYDSICVPVDMFDPDGDDLDIEFLEGLGSFNYATNSFCFLPDMIDVATYTFVLKASDSCCVEVEGAKPGLVPRPCPRDTINITVTVNLTPELVTVPDFDTILCEPSEICFPVTAIDGNEGDNVTITVDPPASYNDQTGEVCFMADQETTYSIVITATDELCGATAVDTVNITVDLNNAPDLTVPNDTSYYFCSDPGEICFDNSVYDPDPSDVHTFTLVSGLGSIDPVSGQVCFTPVEDGDYQFIIKVTDICQVEDQDTVNISIDLNRPPVITLPDDYAVLQCDPAEICFTATADDPDLPDDELTFIKVSGFGSIDPQTGELCFTPVGAGDYEFIIRVRDLCNEIDQDTITITIDVNTPPTLTVEPYTSTFFCQLGDTACITLTADDPDLDETLTFAQVSGPGGQLDPNTGEFCFLTEYAGDYIFEFSVTDKCGDADTASVTVNVVLNEPPEITLPGDFTDTVCAVNETICFDISIYDSDNNYTVEVLPIGSYNNGQICFDPIATGDTTFCLTVIATDECDISSQAEICITVHYNMAPTIEVDPDVILTVCDAPDAYCFGFTASDPDGPDPTVEIIDGSGTVGDGEICLDIDTAGSYCVTIRAIDECGAYQNTEFCVSFMTNMPPTLIAIDDFESDYCEPTEICFDVNATDPNLPNETLTYSLVNPPPGGTIDQNGRICFTPTGPGVYSITIRVTDVCGNYDQKTISVTVDMNEPPVITATDDSLYIVYCGQGAPEEEACFGGLTVSDPDDDVETLTVEMISGLGTFDPTTMTTCFNPPVANDIIEFIYQVSDTCGAIDKDTILFHVEIDEECDSLTCLEVWIEESPCVPTNTNLELAIRTDVSTGIGGFDLVIKYDPTAFALLDVFRGAATVDWEYFTYRTGDVGGCNGACPDGLVRIVAIADRNDGPSHPPAEAYNPIGDIVILKFYVTADLNFSGLVYAVDFYWLDCADNGFSSRTGDTLFVEKIIYNPYGVVWDEFDDVNYPDDDRYPNVGIPDSCLDGGKTKPHRCVIMHNGSICIIHPDSIDARGDMNLNDIAYEIADVVLFTNYFIYGPSVFKVNYDGQVAASDCNADGRTLTVGDLIYMIRVLTNDVDPYAKQAQFINSVDLNLEQGEGEYAIRTNSDVDIGGAHFIFDISGARSIPEFVKSDDLNNMELEYSIDDDVMRVLVYSYKTERIDPGDNLLGTILVDGEIELVSTDMADYQGSDLIVNTVRKQVIPQAFELSQNYPNPFNPETEIQLALPEESDWQIDVYNIQGQVVKSFSGHSPAGVVTITFQGDNLASGMYFYRAIAGEYTETRKMILLK